MVIDPSTNLGRLRLLLGDWGDLPILPDSYYTQVLSDTDNSLGRSTKILGMSILAIFSQGYHRRLNQLESWPGEKFTNYQKYITMLVKDPAFAINTISPIPYSKTADYSPILDFQANWMKNYPLGTQSQELASDADVSPNDGGRLGPLGTVYNGWNA